MDKSLARGHARAILRGMKADPGGFLPVLRDVVPFLGEGFLGSRNGRRLFDAAASKARPKAADARDVEVASVRERSATTLVGMRLVADPVHMERKAPKDDEDPAWDDVALAAHCAMVRSGGDARFFCSWTAPAHLCGHALARFFERGTTAPQDAAAEIGRALELACAVRSLLSLDGEAWSGLPIQTAGGFFLAETIDFEGDVAFAGAGPANEGRLSPTTRLNRTILRLATFYPQKWSKDGGDLARRLAEAADPIRASAGRTAEWSARHGGPDPLNPFLSAGRGFLSDDFRAEMRDRGIERDGFKAAA